MIPHLAVEEVLLQGLEAASQIVYITTPHERKGEQQIVLYKEEAGDADALHDIIRNSTRPTLWHPRKDNHFPIDEMPALGSGKLDMKKLNTIAKEEVKSK